MSRGINNLVDLCIKLAGPKPQDLHYELDICTQMRNSNSKKYIIMELFKKIIKCLKEGGSVYESTTDFHVIAYLRSGGYNCLYLGVDKSVFLEIPAVEINDRDLCFSLWDKDGESYE